METEDAAKKANGAAPNADEPMEDLQVCAYSKDFPLPLPRHKRGSNFKDMQCQTGSRWIAAGLRQAKVLGWQFTFGFS